MMAYPNDLDLDGMISFFSDYQKSAMPKDLLALTMSGIVVMSRGLRTGLVQWRALHDLVSPEFATKIAVPGPSHPVPYVRTIGGPDYSVYQPFDGAYVGNFDIAKAEEAFYKRKGIRRP